MNRTALFLQHQSSILVSNGTKESVHSFAMEIFEVGKIG